MKSWLSYLRLRQDPKNFSYWTLARWIMYAVILTAIEMGFYFREHYQTDSDKVHQLISDGAEDQLYAFLRSDDTAVVQLATQGLWECWLNEAGAEARTAIEEGIRSLNGGEVVAAERVFRALSVEHPDWAEALNKRATALYLLNRHEESLALCQKVVALKPNHFGAWSGMALCAIQLRDWRLARQAAREAVRIQPHSESNRQILRAIDQQIPKLDV